MYRKRLFLFVAALAVVVLSLSSFSANAQCIAGGVNCADLSAEAELKANRLALQSEKNLPAPSPVDAAYAQALTDLAAGGTCSFNQALDQFYFTDFESSDGGWVESGFGEWERGAVVTGTYEFCDTSPSPEPGGAFSGTNVFATNLNGCYQNSNQDSILSQTFDFSSRSAPIFINLQHWYHVFETFDYAIIRVNGTQVFRTPNSTATSSYVPQLIDLSAYAGNPSVNVEFLLHTTTVVNRMGWYVDNIELCSGAGATPTPTATATGVPPTNTPTATNTTVPPTNTATATPGSGGRICSSTVVTIPDSNPTGVTSVINVGTAGTISDLNVVISSTHTWVGDLAFNLSNGTNNVTFFDRPGVPASTFGCSSDNIDGSVADDEGTDGAWETTCLAGPPAYLPGGTYTNNAALSVFDGAAAAGNWTLTVSDNAGGDTGTLDGWCVDITTGAGPTPTATPTAGQVPDINVNPGSFTETHASAPQVTTDTMNIQNVGSGSLTWTITEDDSRPWNAPNAAQPRDPNAPVNRLAGAGNGKVSPLVLGPIVGDGSFETGTPNASWEEFSSNFGTPLCDAVCGTGGGTGPRTGAWWAWFGGTTSAETGIITQSVTIPSGSAELTFWLEIPPTATGTNGFLSVRMDGTEVFRAEETTAGYGTYAEVSVDASAYADGGSHELVFFSTTDAGAAVTNFFVDDVAITATAGGVCTAPTDIPWLTVSPTNGSTSGGGSTPVTLTYNSASLAAGTYTGTLCVASNDPDEALVTVPITLNVSPPTAIDLSSFTSPVAGVNLGDLAAAGLLLLAGAILILRRK